MEQVENVQFCTPGFDMAQHWRLAQKHGLLLRQEPNGNPSNWPGHWNRNGAFVPYPVLHMDVAAEPTKQYIDGESREIHSIVRTYELRKPSTNAAFCGSYGCQGHLYVEVPWGRWELLDVFPRCGLSQDEMDYFCLQYNAQKVEVKQYMATFGGYDLSQTGLGVTLLGLPDAEGFLPKPQKPVSPVKQRTSIRAAGRPRIPRTQQRVDSREEEPIPPSKEDRTPNTPQEQSPLEGYQWQNALQLVGDAHVSQCSNASDQIGFYKSSGRNAAGADQH